MSEVDTNTLGIEISALESISLEYNVESNYDILKDKKKKSLVVLK